MNSLENYYKKVIKYDLINKFFYDNLNDIPELKKIILNFGCKSFEIKDITPAILSLEMIANQRGSITKSKRANILLKIRKGYPVGCLVILSNTGMYDFLFKLLTEVFPNLKDFKGINVPKNLEQKSFSFTLADLINFKELEKQFYLFTNLPQLHIIFVTNTTTRKELLYLLKSFKLPFFI